MPDRRIRAHARRVILSPDYHAKRWPTLHSRDCRSIRAHSCVQIFGTASVTKVLRVTPDPWAPPRHHHLQSHCADTGGKLPKAHSSSGTFPPFSQRKASDRIVRIITLDRKSKKGRWGERAEGCGPLASAADIEEGNHEPVQSNLRRYWAVVYRHGDGQRTRLGPAAGATGPHVDSRTLSPGRSPMLVWQAASKPPNRGACVQGRSSRPYAAKENDHVA